MIPYALMYRLGLAPWERRDVERFWGPQLERDDVPATGRALDIGCGRGRDAVHLAGRGFEVTAVEQNDRALDAARRLASERGVDVRFVSADVSRIGALSLDPGFDLVYDFGCIQGLPDDARAGAFSGITALTSPGASFLLLAFRSARRILLPRGMNEADVLVLAGSGWELAGREAVVTPDMPPPIRRAEPTLYRLNRA